MATASRIYVVQEEGQAKALIRARSQSEAIRHHNANRFAAIPASQDDLMRLLGDGIQVEDATNGSAPEPTTGAAQG